LVKKYWKMSNFLTKNEKFWKFLFQIWNFILYLWESRKECYNFHFLRYTDLKSCSCVQLLLNTKNTFFPTTKKWHFSAYTIHEGTCMLPKRSTPVDQNFGSESMHSQLFIAIFRAPRTHLVAQKDCI